MDEFFLQLSQLVRAGWTFQIAPEDGETTMPATQGVIVWSYHRAMEEMPWEQPPTYPLIDWTNLFAPEIELRKAVAKMHASIFPDSPFGNFST